jgi:hypothetical protein
LLHLKEGTLYISLDAPTRRLDMVERRVFVVGGHITNFVGRGSPNFNTEAPLGLKEYIAEAVQGALRASGCPGAAVDRSYVGNFAGELFNSQVGTALRPPL